MRPGVIIFLFFGFQSILGFSQTTNISGVINIYTPVTNIECNSVSVESVTGFKTGDRVLLIQMKGATIDLSNTSSFGNITNYNNAGNYEFAEITGIFGSRVEFKYSLLRKYDLNGLVQLIRVPKYVDVNIAGRLTCMPWNGITGGVLVFEASGNVFFNSEINTSGMGFRGRVPTNGNYNCKGDTTNYVLPSGSMYSGLKGEGIIIGNLNTDKGKGAYANGGGGGNDINAGGAGGANYGEGGNGGDILSSASCPANFYMEAGGLGGKKLNYSNLENRIYLGGGGGAGHQNDNKASAGTNGGGIVIIRANNISGNNYSIFSDGVDNTVIAGIDGQGGGGAGGTVLLEVNAFNNLNISVKGGKGGEDSFAGPDCHGKGGGGGGGIVWVSSSTTGLSVDFSGGNPGVFTNPASKCFGGSNGASAGRPGSTLTGLVIPESTNKVKVDLGPDILVCEEQIVQLISITGDHGKHTFDWNNGLCKDSLFTVTPEKNTMYTLKVTDANGCVASDTVNVSVCFQLYIPNTFTPNNDALNDYFLPVISNTNIDFYELLIFNRWGEVIFRSDDPLKGWDGHKIGGRHIAEQDVYVWKLTAGYTDGEQFENTGLVTLIR